MKELNDLKEYVISQLQEGEFLEVIEEINFSTRNARDDLGEVLASLHNEGKIDFISYYKGLKKESTSRDFYTYKILFENALPVLESSIHEVIEVVLQLHIESAGDLTSCDIFEPFTQFLIKRQTFPKQALQLVMTDHIKYLPLVSSILIAGSKIDLSYFFIETQEIFEGSDLSLKRCAIHTLGVFDYQNELKLIDKASDLITRVSAEDVELAPVAAVTAIKLCEKTYKGGLTEEELEGFIEGLFISPSQELIFVAANQLWRSRDNVSEKLKGIFLHSLKGVQLESSGALNIIDYVLQDLVKHDDVSSALELVEAILCSPEKPISIKKFDSFVNLLLTNNGDLGNILVEWLSSNEKRLWKASFELIGDLGKSKIAVDGKAFTSFSDLDFIFLGRKVVGWFYYNQIFAAQFLLKIMEYAPAEALKPLAQLVYNPLLVSYASVSDFLEAYETESVELKAIINELLSQMESYKNNLSNEPLKEFHIPTSWRDAYYQKQQKQQEIAQKEAEKDSFFLNMFSRQILLYGRKTISFIDHGEGEMQRIESPLSTYSHSFEIPRLSFIDPHGLDLQLRTFRVETKKI